MRPRIRSRWPAGLMVLCLAVAGCGSSGAASGSPSDGPPASGTGLADACSFMTIDEASQALGSKVDTATPFPGAIGCTYEITGSPAVIAFQFTDEEHWNQAHDDPHTDIQLGDEAVYHTDTGFTAFTVRKGATYLSLGVQLADGATKSAVDVGSAAVGFVLSRTP